jgi:hypothetical protein
MKNRKQRKSKPHFQNLAISSCEAMRLGKRPASGYHCNKDVKFWTCNGVCANRVCALCSFFCDRCGTRTCGNCMTSDNNLCLSCSSSDAPVFGLDEHCYKPTQQYLANRPVQKPAVARRLVFHDKITDFTEDF